MGDSIKTVLAASGVLHHVVLPTCVDALLSALEVHGSMTPLDPEVTTGFVTLAHDLTDSPVPGFDFALAVPDPGVVAPVKLKLEPAPAPSSFKLWLLLADETRALTVFKFVKGIPGLVLTGATRTVASDGSIGLEPLPAADPRSQPVLVSRAVEPGAALGPALLVTGSAAAPATMRFTPDTDSTDGVISLGVEPPTVVFGESRIGFELPSLIIDDSQHATGPGRGAPALDPPVPVIGADTPAWRGILARELNFYLPADLPLFGGQPINGYVAIARDEGGAELIIETTVPARPAAPGVAGRPSFHVRIESRDPTATGLGGLVPTLITASMELPLDGATAAYRDEHGAEHGITFAAGKPVRATATLARDPVNAPGTLTAAVGVAAQGPDGLLSVAAREMGGAKIFNTAAALATALIADKDVERAATVGDTDGVVLATLLGAGTALSSLFTDPSRFVLHGLEIESSGHGAPVGGPLVLTLDYSVAVVVTSVEVGILSVSMDPDQPMRIRVRNARLSLDPTQSGLDMIGLDFDHSTMEIESPGAWNVGGLASLFDVLGSRSGRGSSWLEVDLGFKLNLGPVRVSGATIRATLLPSGDIEASLRGLEAGVAIPGAIEANGALRLLDPAGFAADLRATVVPLNLVADAGIVYAPPMVLLRLDADLPAPVPLANTGFGLLGIGGLLAFSGRPDYESVGEGDPVAQQLKWQPRDDGSFRAARGQTSFGLTAAVGTLPDLGFTFSAKAGLLITVPDVAVRGSLNGRVLQPAVKVTDPGWPPTRGISFLGFIALDRAGLSFGLLGQVDLLPLLEIRVPIAGRFPLSGDTSDWYVYLGADGAPVEGRSIGPISARVLPDFLAIEADAYFIARGNGITDWPHGRRQLSVADGFVVAFGFRLQTRFGVKPVVWADLYAGLDLLVGSKPPTLAGFGRAGGSLNLGPFSLGVDAQVSFKVVERAQYFWAEVTGRIELFFFDVEGTVTISFGDKDLAPRLPPPDRHPLDRIDANRDRAGSLGVITDDRYRVVAELVEHPAAAQTVWPDAIVSLPFAVAPAINFATAGTQFPGAVGPGATPAPVRLGTEMLHYNWRLERIELRDVTDEPDAFNGPGTLPAGGLAARWQAPRSGPGAGDISELLLFSTGPDVWVNRLADGAATLPGGSPLQAAANICVAVVADPESGWAIGYRATRDTDGYRLPPEYVSASPRVSRVAARMVHLGLHRVIALFGSGIREMSLHNAHALPEPFTLVPAALVAWPHAGAVDGRAFDGYLTAPCLRWLSGRSLRELSDSGGFLAQAIRLEFDEPIVAGELVLIVNPELVVEDDEDVVTGVRVRDDQQRHWPRAAAEQIPTGEIACVFRAPSDDAVSGLFVTYPLGECVGVVGIGGITESARTAAASEHTMLEIEKARRAAAAAAGPPPTPPTDAPHQRTILDPGRLYRIDVDMTWAGQVARQNAAGQIEVDPSQSVTFGGPGSDQYGGGLPTKKQFFFRTADKTPTPPPDVGTPLFLPWLFGRADVFRPEMLARYLAGYEPAQSETFRFCDDPLRAHFLADHVAALAKAYGFALEVAIRRVDRPGPAYAEPTFWTPLWAFATNPLFLTAIDQMRHGYAIASACQTPTPGSTASVPSPALEPLAWYDLYVRARSLESGFNDGVLDGVTFQTSRWRDPAAMLAGLGFSVPGHAPAPVVAGDLEVLVLTGPAIVDDDAAFTGALGSLGLGAWPATDTPRLSRLWLHDGTAGWMFAGLLIESPEPIHRPRRVEVRGLEADPGTGAAIGFSLVRRDRLGMRLLFLATTPFPVSPPGGVLALRVDAALGGVVTPLVGVVPIRPVPDFADEP